MLLDHDSDTARKYCVSLVVESSRLHDRSEDALTEDQARLLIPLAEWNPLYLKPVLGMARRRRMVDREILGARKPQREVGLR